MRLVRVIISGRRDHQYAALMRIVDRRLIGLALVIIAQAHIDDVRPGIRRVINALDDIGRIRLFSFEHINREQPSARCNTRAVSPVIMCSVDDARNMRAVVVFAYARCCCIGTDELTFQVWVVQIKSIIQNGDQYIRRAHRFRPCTFRPDQSVMILE